MIFYTIESRATNFARDVFPDTCYNFSSIDREWSRRNHVGCTQTVWWRISGRRSVIALSNNIERVWRVFQVVNLSSPTSVSLLVSSGISLIINTSSNSEISLLSGAWTRMCVKGVRRRHRTALQNERRGLSCVLREQQGKGRRRMRDQYMASSRGD